MLVAKQQCLDWLLTGEVGLSSKAMACAMFGDGSLKHYPHDPDDFNRCLKFLNAIEGSRTQMYKLSYLSDEWKMLVKRWDEIEQCFLNEVGIDWGKGKSLKAEKTYRLMKEIIGG